MEYCWFKNREVVYSELIMIFQLILSSKKSLNLLLGGSVVRGNLGTFPCKRRRADRSPLQGLAFVAWLPAWVTIVAVIPEPFGLLSWKNSMREPSCQKIN